MFENLKQDVHNIYKNTHNVKHILKENEICFQIIEPLNFSLWNYIIFIFHKNVHGN